MLRISRWSLTAAVLLAWVGPAPAQVVVGRVDDFQDGTTLNWTNGGFNMPINVPNGGPNGSGDHFLQVMAQGGTGPGSKLITFNRVRWSGDFLNAGSPGAAVTAVSMDLRAPTTDPLLKIRIAMKSATNQSAPGYVSTTPFDLPNDGLWHHAVFAIDALSLTGINNPTALNTFLQSVAEFRILHSANTSLDGDSVIATLGVDNITPIPEPSALLFAGLASIGFWRQRRAHAQRRS
jgi:PEP-CTERM motif-containing protein